MPCTLQLSEVLLHTKEKSTCVISFPGAEVHAVFWSNPPCAAHECKLCLLKVCEQLTAKLLRPVNSLPLPAAANVRCNLWQLGVQLKDMVRQQAAHDVDPPLSEAASYIKNEMSKEGYRHLLAVGMVLPVTCRWSASQVSCCIEC